MRSRSIVLVALAIGCGLVAAIGISQLMDSQNRAGDLGERQPVFVALNDIKMKTGDGAAVSDEQKLEITAQEDTEILLFDLA